MLTISNLNAYDYFGLYAGPETKNMLFFTIADKDSITKTCYLTSRELEINHLEAFNFTLTNEDFNYSIYSEKNEIDIRASKEFDYYFGVSTIEGFAGQTYIYKFDKETLNDLDKYCGTYYSIDKKDSIIISIKDSISLLSTRINNPKIKIDKFTLYPKNSEVFITNSGFQFRFKLRNFIPWQIMYLFEGQEYFFYKEL